MVLISFVCGGSPIWGTLIAAAVLIKNDCLIFGVFIKTKV